MQNATMKIDAATVQRIVERHINESLRPGTHARVTTMVSGYAASPIPNQPNVELVVTFDAASIPPTQ